MLVLVIGCFTSCIVILVFLLRGSLTKHLLLNKKKIKDLEQLRIPLQDVKEATKKFTTDIATSGQYGSVYKGKLSTTSVAIMRLSVGISNHVFLRETHLISSYKHPNLVSLLRFCEEGDDKILIYENAKHGSLKDHLSMVNVTRPLTWMQRLDICINAARGLEYLHNQGAPHGDIKSSNVLLHKKWKAMIGNHGLSRISNATGTFGYLYQSYMRTQMIKHYDVYSFGVVLFQVLCGRLAFIDVENKQGSLVSLVKQYYKEGKLMEIVDVNLKTEVDSDSISRFFEIAYECLEDDRKRRPSMGLVVKKLEDILKHHLIKFYQSSCDEKKTMKELITEFHLDDKDTMEDFVSRFVGWMDASTSKVKELNDCLAVKNFTYLKIPLRLIKLATDDFSSTYCIMSHADYMVYKAELNHFDEERVLATKGENKGEMSKKILIIKCIMNQNYLKFREDFLAEIAMLNSFRHSNLLSLLGFCDEESEMILVFNCAFKQTLVDYVGSMSEGFYLTWEQRIRICLDIAYGLKYLHDMKGKLTMIHRGIHIAKVFLDEKWNAKIANFRQFEYGSYPISLKQLSCENFRTWLWGHADAPWIPSWQRLVEDDIYSLGVILFEILTGRLDMVENGNGFASLACGDYIEETLRNMADPRIMEETQESNYTLRTGPDPDSLDTFSKITYQCLAETPSERPTLDVVILSLEKALHFQVCLQHLKIPLSDIVLATKNFDEEYLLGYGGYGAVYKAVLNHFDIKSFMAPGLKCKDGHQKIRSTVAVKRIFQREDSQGKEGFLVELDILSKCEHPNIVRLLGYCDEGNEMLLVYELVSNGSLNDCLGSTDNMYNLTWAQRIKMCIDVAQGLSYLHTTMEDKKGIIHRDIKSDNILLGKNWEVKIADFGLSKFQPRNQKGSTIVTNRVVGTNVYMDPEYALSKKLKKASDIYSFGVVLFEIYSGKLAYDSNFILKNGNGLAPIAKEHFENQTLKEILDPKLMDEAHELISTLKVGPDPESLNTFSKIAYQCVAKTQVERPTIEEVIKELKEALKFQENRKYAFKFSLEDIQLGTRNFSVDNCITKGYGRLYVGEVPYISGGKKVVIKQFPKWDPEKEFFREYEVLYKHKHENIIGLVGYCVERNEKNIVYEHAFNGCLATYMNDSSLSWSTRLKICIDIANVLDFLHGGDKGKEVVVHRDIKSSNILLTEDWKAKICGFNRSLTYPTNQKMKHAINDVDSPAYYYKTHDIYLFGVILIEILCGRSMIINEFTNHLRFLDELVEPELSATRVDDIVFEGIKKQIVQESLAAFQSIAFQCLHKKREKRPIAGKVVLQLQKALEFQEAYEIWEAKLPKNYIEILKDSKFHETYSIMAKKYIHDILSKGILLQDDKRWFSIDDNGERNEMISARMFSYKNRWSHRWRSIQESRFQKVAEMLDLSNLNIQIKIRPRFLPSDVKYSVHLVFKFYGPSKSHAKRMYVNLRYKMGKENLHAYFATWRDDDWMMIELCRFSNHKKDTNFEVLLEGFSRCYCDSRAIYIEGIEFRAVENVKQEKMEKLQETQQVMTSLSDMKREVYHMVSAESIVYDSPNSNSLTRSRGEWIYKVPQQSVFCIKWYIDKSQMVSPNTECACYLVFKLSRNSDGLHCPVIVRDQFHWKSKKIIYFRSPSPWNLHDTDCVPKKRKDGWREVIVSKFNSDFVLKKGWLSRKLKLISYEGTMFGLIISGLEFRPMEE